MARNQAGVVHDVGIAGSLDPVALDRASIDLVNQVAGQDVFRQGYNLDWSIQLAHGEKIGLGSQDYRLIEINRG